MKDEVLEIISMGSEPGGAVTERRPDLTHI